MTNISSLMAKKMIDLETHFAVFKTHHSHRVNFLLHTIVIYPIQFSLFILFHLTPPFLCIPILGQINLAFLLALVFIATNLLLDPKAGFVAGILWVFCFTVSSSLVSTLGFSLSLKFALATFIFGTAFILVGHEVFEKHAPPNSYILQVLLMEPFCIFIEVLHILFNYEPYPGFYNNVDKKIEANSKQSESSKLKKIG